MQYLPLLLVLLAGLGQPFQAAMNAKMAKAASSPAWPALVSFVPSVCIILLLWSVYVLPRGRATGLTECPWWVWLSGPIGCVIILSALIALPISGAGLVIAIMVLGQATSSLLIDHYGWLGVKTIPMNAWRIGGAVLILGGVLMMQKKG